MSLLSPQQVFQEPPENFESKLEAAACYLIAQENVLFLKREQRRPQGGLWGIPGGKFEKGETAEQAVIREIREETGIALSNRSLKSLGKVYIRLPDVDFTYHMFAHSLEKIPSAIVLDPVEHTEYQWLTLQEALKLPLIRGEVECIYLAYGSELKVSHK